MLKLSEYLKNPSLVVIALNSKGYLKWMPDKSNIKLMYRVQMGNRLNLRNPHTYNEKLQWIKLYDRNPLYSGLVDKYEVRQYVEKTIGADYLIPLIAVWNNADEIDSNELPNRFVLKCNHDSGSVVICKDKNTFDFQEAKAKLKRCLERSGDNSTREWPYRNVKRKIVCEEYMEDEKTSELRDYKFFSFGGKVKAMFVASDRQNPNGTIKFDYFDENYNRLDIRQDHAISEKMPEKPINFDLMKELAEKLSKDIPHVRVDFYEANGKVYFGEMTFFHHSGYVPFYPKEWDDIFGEWFVLPKKQI